MAIEDLRLSLHEICSSFSQDLQVMKLSTTEMQAANFIRQGKRREIDEIMCEAQSAVNTHRNNIRKKVGLKKTKKTLRAYLSSL